MCSSTAIPRWDYRRRLGRALYDAPMTEQSLTAALKAEAARLGFAAAAVTTADPAPEAREVIEARIARGSYGGLPWFTAERAARATTPATALDGVRSIVTLAAPYRAVFDAGGPALDDQPRGRVARYAWGRDYHRVLEKPLKALGRWLAEREPGVRSRGMVDYGPLAERAFAARAGLGWFGKSTNLLTPAGGSWVLLADLLTSAALEPDAPLRKSCGGCTRCLVACPTGALTGPYDLENRLCISFQTIEQRGPIPRALRPLLGDWLFGCDVCQDACPVPSRAEALVEFRPASLDDAAPPLIPLLSLSEEGFRARFAGRPLMRAKRAGLLRNACVALANIGDDRAVPALTAALADPAPLVRGHAAWALGRFGRRATLAAALRDEADAWVREEIEAALADEDNAVHVPAQQPLAEWLAGARWVTANLSPVPSPARGWMPSAGLPTMDEPRY